MEKITFEGKEVKLIYATADNIKVGDNLIIHYRGSWKIDKVVTITPKRNFRTEKGGYYDECGREKGNGIWIHDEVFLYNEEAAQLIKKRHFSQLILHRLSKLQNITYEQACEVNKILGLVEVKS